MPIIQICTSQTINNYSELLYHVIRGVQCNLPSKSRLGFCFPIIWPFQGQSIRWHWQQVCKLASPLGCGFCHTICGFNILYLSSLYLYQQSFMLFFSMECAVLAQQQWQRTNQPMPPLISYTSWVQLASSWKTMQQVVYPWKPPAIHPYQLATHWGCRVARTDPIRQWPCNKPICDPACWFPIISSMVEFPFHIFERHPQPAAVFAVIKGSSSSDSCVLL